MKYILFIFVSVFIAVSCIDDKTNLDYKEINEYENWKIEGIDGSVPKIYYFLMIVLVIFVLAVDTRKTYLDHTEKKGITGLLIFEVLVLFLPFILIR